MNHLSIPMPIQNLGASGTTQSAARGISSNGASNTCRIIDMTRQNQDIIANETGVQSSFIENEVRICTRKGFVINRQEYG